jgi:sec-independent protein translocase protein TatB
MGNLGGGEVLVILLVALLVLGPAKLPEAARQVGRAMGEIRKVTAGFQRELQDALKDSDDAAARRRGEAIAATRPVASAPHLLDHPAAATAGNGAPATGAAPATAATNGTAATAPPAPAASGAVGVPSTGATTPVDAVVVEPVTRDQAPARIPPAPAGDATPLAPGSDR